MVAGSNVNHTQPSNSMLRSSTTRSEAQNVWMSDDTLQTRRTSRRNRLESRIGMGLMRTPTGWGSR